MGVTPTHPLYIAGAGWGEAGALVAGDAIRDRDLQPLTVLAVEVDTTPQMVHNLEIAEAHTYFAGELEAWGHNAINPFSGKQFWEIAQMFRNKGFQRCSFGKTRDGVPNEWLNPKTGFKYFLDDSGYELPDIGDHVDVRGPCTSRAGKKRFPL